ncbi:MAG: hypothetical protein HOV79_09980 [Hamadaea sp.]|nr:hypothetical protein [Hamadaea sp.]
MTAPEGELVTDIVPGPGGVMTDEVGVVTGDLTLKTVVTPATAGAAVQVTVQYRGADEWYAVTGGAVPVADPVDAKAVHQLAVGLLHRPEG